MKKVVVLGSNSFSGSHFVNHLLEHTDWDIIGISRSLEYSALFLPYLYQKERSPRFQFFRLNLNTELSEIMTLLDKEKPEVIVNFAAQGNVAHSWDNPTEWLMTNTVGIANLTFRLRDRQYLRKYIQISTPEIYGLCHNLRENVRIYNPSTPYAVSKVAGDLFLNALFKKFKFPVCFVRSTNFYGPHQQLYRIIPKTIIYLKLGKKLSLHGGGIVKRDFISIYDVVDGIYKVIEHGEVGNVYHFSYRKLIRIRDLVKFICVKMNSSFEDSVKISSERSDQDSAFSLNSRAKKELGWEPTISLPSGIDGVIRWVDENWDEILKNPLEYIHQV